MSLTSVLSSFKRNLLCYSLVFGVGISSCTKEDSSPTDIYNPPGGNNDEYVEDSGRTNYDGELKLDVDGQKFDVYVTDENNNGLENIVANGDYFGNDIYGFSFEDFNHGYFSSVKYVDMDGVSSVSGIDGFRINQSLNKIRGRKYEKKFLDKNGPYPYDLSQNEGLNFMETISIDGLHDFYVDNDAIFQNVSSIEFMRDLTGSPELSFALEAAKFRQTFIEDLNNYNDIVNSVAFLFGGSFQKEAYYIDVYESKLLHILTHQTTTKGNYITLKGTVYDNSNSDKLEGVFVNITRGPVLKSTYSDDNGNYFLKSLTEGFYEIDATLPGFTKGGGGKRLSFFGYIQPRCEEYPCYLTPESQSQLDTLILQPGPEGKDASIFSKNPNTNYGDEDELGMSYDPWERGDGIGRSFAFLDISSIPLNSNIKSAKLSMRGASGEDGKGLDDPYIAIKKVLDNWNENQINWNNQPRFDSYTYATLLFNHWPTYEWRTFNLTDLVQEWVNENNNKGIAIVLDQESGRRISVIYSSDIDNPSYRYKLEVIYEY